MANLLSAATAEVRRLRVSLALVRYKMREPKVTLFYSRFEGVNT